MSNALDGYDASEYHRLNLATLRDGCCDAEIWKPRPAVRCEHCGAITGHHLRCPNLKEGKDA